MENVRITKRKKGEDDEEKEANEKSNEYIKKQHIGGGCGVVW